MIRVLVIGSGAKDCVQSLGSAAPAVDFEATRLPAAGIRAFERSPADVVVLRGAATERFVDLLAALRERPLGRLVPCLWIGDGELEGADASVASDESVESIVELIAELVDSPIDALAAAPQVAVPQGEVTAAEIERKLRQVRHETYFAVLEVADDVTPSDLREAFARQCGRFEAGVVPDDIARRFESELAEVRDGVEDAFAVLSNEKLRAAYVDARRAR